MRGKVQSVNISFQSGGCTGTYVIYVLQYQKTMHHYSDDKNNEKEIYFGKIEKR